MTSLPAPTNKMAEEALKCRLCWRPYRVDGRRPIELRCAHTFCEQCLDRVLLEQTAGDGRLSKDRKREQQTTSHELVCPTCSTATLLSRGETPRSLPVNPIVMELMLTTNVKHLTTTASAGTTARAADNAARFSQVHVSTLTKQGYPAAPSADGVTHGRSGNAAASIARKVENRLGSNQPDRRLMTDASGDDAAAFSTPVNWVSTINVGGGSSQYQHRQPLAQDVGNAIQPATAKSASSVTSISTSGYSMSSTAYRPQSQTSRNVVPPETPTVAPTAETDMCSRCGLRPATVSVARSSQTVAPQKLCPDCRRHPQPTRKAADSSAHSVSDFKTAEVNGIGGSNEPERSANVNKKKANGETGAGADFTSAAPETVAPRNPTSLATNVVATDGDATTNRKSASLLRDRPSPHGAAASRTSTIEIRRRPADSRRAAAPTAKASDDVEPSAAVQTGTVSQQPPSTEQRRPGSASSTAPPQSAAARVQQPATGRSQMPTVTTEPRSHPAARTSDNGRLGSTIPDQQASQLISSESMAGRSSAPTITDIHPLPCANPPYNPDFEEEPRPCDTGVNSETAVWPTAAFNHNQRQQQQQQRPTNLVDAVRHQRQKLDDELATMTGNQMSLSFMLQGSRGGHMLPAHPPKYEDIVHDSVVPTATSSAAALTPDAPPNSDRESPVTATRPSPSSEVPPPSSATSASTSVAAGMRLVRSFGKYGEIVTQPGAFRSPARLSVSPAVAGAESGGCRIVISDRANSTVQVFDETGDCLTMLRADAVVGCCLAADNDRLLAATDRGVEVYNKNGLRQDSIPLGGVLTVVRYQTGFIAVQSKSLSVFKGSTATSGAGAAASLSRTLTSKAKPGQFSRLLAFDDICDVAVNSQQDLVVLEASSGGLVTVMTDDGYIKSTISAAQLDACGRLQSPCAVAVDSAHNVLVCESGRGARILLFGANGRLLRSLYGPSSPHPPLPATAARSGSAAEAQTGPWPAGLALDQTDRLYVVMRADKFAEVRVFDYL